jgi:intein-encoded DNA endonuclease-like protein
MSLDKEILKLYSRNIPIREISRNLKISRERIRKTLTDNKVEIKKSRDALILRGYIKEKKKFNLSNQEKAYLFGLVMGDLTPVIKSKYTLKLITHTTHPYFITLLENSFKEYGPTSSKKNKINEFRFSTYLDLESFSFLLESKNRRLPNWIDNKNLFWFLAGFIDSDGCVMIRKCDKYFQCVIRFFGQNLEILNEIKSRLEKLSYKVSMHISHHKGFTSYSKGVMFRYNKNYYIIEIYRKEETIRLLKIIPIKHPEKLAKRNLIFDLEKKFIYWKDVKDEIKKLNEKIEESVISQIPNTLN